MDAELPGGNSVIALIVGTLSAAVVGLFAHVIGYDQDRAFYARSPDGCGRSVCPVRGDGWRPRACSRIALLCRLRRARRSSMVACVCGSYDVVAAIGLAVLLLTSRGPEI
jgi:hypothetical protein